MSILGRMFKPVTSTIKTSVAEVKRVRHNIGATYKREVTKPISSAKHYYKKEIKPEIPKAKAGSFGFAYANTGYASKINNKRLFK